MIPPHAASRAAGRDAATRAASYTPFRAPRSMFAEHPLPPAGDFEGMTLPSSGRRTPNCRCNGSSSPEFPTRPLSFPPRSPLPKGLLGLGENGKPAGGPPSGENVWLPMGENEWPSIGRFCRQSVESRSVSMRIGGPANALGARGDGPMYPAHRGLWCAPWRR